MPEQRIDALLIPYGSVAGDSQDRVQGFARDVLSVDEAKGETVTMRSQNYPTGSPDHFWFVTRDPNAMLYYTYGHPQVNQPRYKWERQPDGIWHGTLR